MLKDGWLAVPQVVNNAFAVELAFKGIMLLAKGEAPKGHDLKQLFDQLPADAADAVRAGTGKDPEFESKIAGVADSFEVWRYVHEKSGASVNVEFLAQLAKVSIDTLLDTFKAKKSQAGTP